MSLLTWPVSAHAAPVDPLNQTLPMPRDIPNGATVGLKCGAIYQGTLDLADKHDVTVRTVGTCGMARLSPGRAIHGWVKHAGNIYVAPIDFTPMQVAVAGVAVSAAHWPNHGWAKDAAGMPRGELKGATLVVLENQSVVRSSSLAGNAIATDKPFYIEGKRWMLDSPGEWAVQDGRLYLWTPNGGNPEGQVWAAPDRSGINADRSHRVLIDGVAIFSAADGISAHHATDLTVRNSSIDNSARDGIWASGSTRLRVDASRVSNARRNGINGWYWIQGARIADSEVSNTGMAGMPSASDAAILLGGGSDNHVNNVRVSHSAYHGINMLHSRSSSVRNSLIDTACARLADCGAIYASARDRRPLKLLIEGNRISHASAPGAIGIYLDDHANAVDLRRNRITDNQRALVVHNGFATSVTGNLFARSSVLHVGLSEDSGNIRKLRIAGNTFRSTRGEQTFNLEARLKAPTGSAPDLAALKHFRTFASIDDNLYTVHSGVFGHLWDGRADGVALHYRQWFERMRQDAGSRLKQQEAAPPRNK